MQVNSDEIIFPIQPKPTDKALTSGKLVVNNLAANSSFVSALPDPGMYRRSSLLIPPNRAEGGLRVNNTFSGPFGRSHNLTNTMNNSLGAGVPGTGADLKSSMGKKFMGNRSNLNVSFQLADEMAQRKINSIVSKIESKPYSDTVTPRSSTSLFRRHSADISDRRSGLEDIKLGSFIERRSQLDDEKLIEENGNDENSVDDLQQTADREKGDKFSTDKLDQEIKQTSAMIRELTKKLQEREKKEEKTATRKQEITDITNQKREQYVEAAKENVQLAERIRLKADKCAKLARKIEEATKSLEDTRYSISRLRLADNELHQMKWVHYRLKKTIDHQNRLMEEVSAEISEQTGKPVHGGHGYATQLLLRHSRDSNSQLTAVLHKLEQENKSLHSQIDHIRNLPKIRRLSMQSDFTEGFKSIPRRTSIMSNRSGKSRDASRRSSAVGTTISSNTMR
ncbi:uncharacterized protein LOC142350644 [Convolutriloba macropyga]|uniref:uncharacterized protein LOC142350644 n=1 Tax=Convolutriloba macropyga TaxID=536237 RepID=UPI003F521CF6